MNAERARKMSLIQKERRLKKEFEKAVALANKRIRDAVNRGSGFCSVYIPIEVGARTGFVEHFESLGYAVEKHPFCSDEYRVTIRWRDKEKSENPSGV